MTRMQSTAAPGGGGRQLSAGLVLATLFLGTFVLVTAELIVVGLLNLIASDVRVSLPAAGTLVTANALGLAIGGPILTALTIKLDKRIMLLGSLGLFILANLVLVMTAHYGLLIATRALAGAVQGLFIAAGFAVSITVVSPERAGRAMSVVVSGITMAAALGLPLGTLVGQAVGWRGSFAVVVGLATIALIAVAALVPSVPATGASVGDQARYAFAPPVLAVLLLNTLVFAALLPH